MNLRFPALAVVAASLVLSGLPAAAQPTQAGDLLAFPATPNGRYFVPLPIEPRNGRRVIEIWRFYGLNQAASVEGHTIVGAWVETKVDCEAKTLGGQEFVWVNAELGQALRSRDESTPVAAVPNTPAGATYELLCLGAEPPSTFTVVHGLREAVDLSQGLRSAALAAPAED